MYIIYIYKIEGHAPGSGVREYFCFTQNEEACHSSQIFLHTAKKISGYNITLSTGKLKGGNKVSSHGL